jgi:hypothetical protein
LKSNSKSKSKSNSKSNSPAASKSDPESKDGKKVGSAFLVLFGLRCAKLMRAKGSYRWLGKLNLYLRSAGWFRSAGVHVC